MISLDEIGELDADPNEAPILSKKGHLMNYSKAVIPYKNNFWISQNKRSNNAPPPASSTQSSPTAMPSQNRTPSDVLRSEEESPLKLMDGEDEFLRSRKDRSQTDNRAVDWVSYSEVPLPSTRKTVSELDEVMTGLDALSIKIDDENIRHQEIAATEEARLPDIMHPIIDHVPFRCCDKTKNESVKPRGTHQLRLEFSALNNPRLSFFRRAANVGKAHRTSEEQVLNAAIKSLHKVGVLLQ